MLLSSLHTGKGSGVRNVSQVVIYGTFPIFYVISGNIWDSILGKAVCPPYHKELSSFTIHNWGKTQEKVYSYFHMNVYMETFQLTKCLWGSLQDKALIIFPYQFLKPWKYPGNRFKNGVQKQKLPSLRMLLHIWSGEKK